MRHVPSQYNLVSSSGLEVLVEIGSGEGTGVLLADGFLRALGSEFFEFFGEGSGGSEDGGAFGRLVDYVHDGRGGGAVFFEERVDCFAGGGDVDGFEVAFGVSERSRQQWIR